MVAMGEEQTHNPSAESGTCACMCVCVQVLPKWGPRFARKWLGCWECPMLHVRRCWQVIADAEQFQMVG